MTKALKRAKSLIFWNAMNIPGWRTNRKIVVIESDDWGSIRMPSKEVYNRFVSAGLKLTDSDYNKIDTLESNEDLELLFEVLRRYRDKNGNHPVITANVVVGNPDFQRIRGSGFNDYHVEPVIETFKRYAGRDKVISLWKSGNAEKIYHPQFHGREHVNVARWMNALKQGSKEIMMAFDNETTFSGEGDYSFMEVLDTNDPEELISIKKSLSEGMDMFEELFGYRSESFIPPCYAWDSEIEETLKKGGVKFIQGLMVQSIPTGTFDNYGKKYHFLGSVNRDGQYFLIRNCFFEPALSKSRDSVGETLKRIGIAFRWHKPAIICTHRINYMGELVPENRTENLMLLGQLLEGITKRWPDVEFLTSDKLGDQISKHKS